MAHAISLSGKSESADKSDNYCVRLLRVGVGGSECDERYRKVSLDEKSLDLISQSSALSSLSESVRIAQATALRDIHYRDGLASGRNMGAIANIKGSQALDQLLVGESKALKEAIYGVHNVRWNETLGAINRTLSVLPETFPALDRQFAMPRSLEIAGLAGAYDNYSKVMRDAMGGIDVMRHRIDAMRTPWLDVQKAILSARTFIEIQAIGGLASAQNPFSPRNATALRGELGDWRDSITFEVEEMFNPVARLKLYDSRGFNSNLTYFNDEAYHETVEVAGLSLTEDATSLNLEVEDEEVARNLRAYQTLLRFEREVRTFVVSVMTTAFGTDWMKHQVPGPTLESWKAKKAKAMQEGEDLPLIEYADFADYKIIIEKADNWKNVFRPIFGRVEDIRESFQRIYPVRIATMHARFISFDDDLLLRVETTRMLRRIRSYGS